MYNKFIRMCDRSWITPSTTSHFHLNNLKMQLKTVYPNSLIQILEDVQIENYAPSVKQQISQALTTGIHSLSDYCINKAYFMQITFLSDEDNCNFIMHMSGDDDNEIKRAMNNINFYNVY